MMSNPWGRLPCTAPFVLPEDKEEVLAFNKKVGEGHPAYLRLEVMPEPFVGKPDAPVVLLAVVY